MSIQYYGVQNRLYGYYSRFDNNDGSSPYNINNLHDKQKDKTYVGTNELKHLLCYKSFYF